jgi:hypothetical protein
MSDLESIHLFSGGRGGGGDDGEERRPTRPTYTGPLYSNVKQLLKALRQDPRFSNVDPRILNEILDGAIQTAEVIGSQTAANAGRRSMGAVGSLASGVILGGIGMVMPLFMLGVAPAVFNVLLSVLTTALDSDDRTKAKSQLYQEVVAKLLRFNRLPLEEQRREFATMSRHSAMRDVLPPVRAPEPTLAPATGERQVSMRDLLFNATRRGAGYSRLGATDDEEDGAPAAAAPAAAGAGGGAEPQYTYADMTGRSAMPDSVRDRVAQMLKEKKEFPPMKAGERKKDD